MPSSQKLCSLVCSRGYTGELKMKSRNGLLLSCKGRDVLSPRLSSFLAFHPAPDFLLMLSWHFAGCHCTRSLQRVALSCDLFLLLMGKLVILSKIPYCCVKSLLSFKITAIDTLFFLFFNKICYLLAKGSQYTKLQALKKKIWSP